MASFMLVGHANVAMFDPAGAELGLNTEAAHRSELPRGQHISRCRRAVSAADALRAHLN
jgi:hypothetical protein